MLSHPDCSSDLIAPSNLLFKIRVYVPQRTGCVVLASDSKAGVLRNGWERVKVDSQITGFHKTREVFQFVSRNQKHVTGLKVCIAL